VGHERIGELPKTKKWKDLVSEMGDLYTSKIKIEDIAKHTAKNVNSQFRKIHKDKGVLTAFKFLITLSVAMSNDNPRKSLLSYGIELPNNPTPLSVAILIQKWIEKEYESIEYGEIAKRSAIDAVVNWYRMKNETEQLSLFNEKKDNIDIWKKAGSGGGFCEIAYLFFAKFTEYYLNYFLEREASGVFNKLEKRKRFKKDIGEYTDEIARHSLETAEIMKSFAAGWFNKNVEKEVPSDQKIQNFMSFAFGKIREELRRESEYNGS